MSRWQYYHQVWLVMILGWIANYMVRAGLSPVLVPIREEFGLTYAEAGLIASALFWAYAATLFPAGYLGDRIGRKVVLVACTLWWTVGSVLTGLAHSFSALFLARFLTGVGQGSYFSNDRPVIAAYTPRDKLGFGQGVSFVGLGTGMAVGYVLGGLISSYLGWRWVFFLFAVPSFLAALLILRVIREPPAPRRVGASPAPEGTPLRALFTSPDLWKLYLGGIPAVYALWMAGTWAPAMFTELGVDTVARSSVLSSLIGISAAPGLILTGFLSDALATRGLGRKGLIAAEFLLTALSLFLMGWAVRRGWSAASGAVILFLVGVFAWGHWAAFYALIADIVPADVRGSCYGLTNSINFIGSLVAPPLTGWVKDLTGSFAWGCYLCVLFLFVGAALILAVRPAFRFATERPIGEVAPGLGGAR